MFNFGKSTLTIALSYLLFGCGYTVPDYIDAMRFKNTKTISQIANQQSLIKVPIQSISQIAFNQNYIVQLCATKDNTHQQICIFNNKYQPIKTINLPLSAKITSTIKIDDLNHVYIITSEPIKVPTPEDKNIEIIKNNAYQIDINQPIFTSAPITQGQKIKEDVLDQLEKKQIYRKLNSNEQSLPIKDYIDLIEEKKFNDRVGDIDDELSLKSTVQIIINIVKGFFDLGQDLVESIIDYQGETLQLSVLSYRELPNSFSNYYLEYLKPLTTPTRCVQPFSEYSFDYILREKATAKIFINVPSISDLVNSKQLKLCQNTYFSDVNEQFLTHHVVTKNHYSGNHYVGGYSQEGFNIYKIKGLTFKAPFDRTSIYQMNKFSLIQDENSQFYLIQ